MKSVEFEAVSSGDHECFCFDVDKDNYEKLVESDFREECPDSCFHESLYKVYMNDILDKLEIGKHKKLKIKIEVEEIL